MELRPSVHVPTPTTRPTIAPKVECVDIETGGDKLFAHVLVPAGMFAQPVHDEDGRPRRDTVTRRPGTDEELGPVGGWGPVDER